MRLRRESTPFTAVTRLSAVAVQTSPPLLYGPKETLAYVAHRALPMYGVLHRILSEVKLASPDFKPRSLLDFGSGMPQ